MRLDKVRPQGEPKSSVNDEFSSEELLGRFSNNRGWKRCQVSIKMLSVSNIITKAKRDGLIQCLGQLCCFCSHRAYRSFLIFIIPTYIRTQSVHTSSCLLVNEKRSNKEHLLFPPSSARELVHMFLLFRGASLLGGVFYLFLFYLPFFFILLFHSMAGLLLFVGPVASYVDKAFLPHLYNSLLSYARRVVCYVGPCPRLQTFHPPIFLFLPLSLFLLEKKRAHHPRFHFSLGVGIFSSFFFSCYP